MKIIIIGGGIGGLTLAIALEQKGIEYEVYEKSPENKPVGAGIWLAPNALQVYEQMGLLAEVQQWGNSIDRITIGRPDLSPISDTPQETIKSHFGYSAWAIHRAELQKLLLSKIPSANVHFGKSIRSFIVDKNNKVEARFNDGTKTVSDYLIGVDGIHSIVRKQLFPESLIRYSGQTCWRGVAHVDLKNEFDNRVYELWGNRVRFGFSRLSLGKYYWFAVALDFANRKDEKNEIKTKLLKLFDQFNPVVRQLINGTDANRIMRNDINDLKPMKNWYKNNVCLIGDAGHATTPNMGQGGAQAIEDAMYLSHFFEKSNGLNVFHLFQKARQAKVNTVVNQSWRTGKMAHWKYGAGLRNLILSSVPRNFLEKKMIDLYTIDEKVLG